MVNIIKTKGRKTKKPSGKEVTRDCDGVIFINRNKLKLS